MLTRTPSRLLPRDVPAANRRLWHISATQILGLDNAQLLPWLPLLDAPVAEIEEAFERLKSAPDHSLTTRLVLLGGLRYGSKEAFLQRSNQMILSDEILQDSSTYHFFMEEGVKRGLAVGRSEGRNEGRNEGLAAGRDEGLAVGRNECRGEALRDALSKLLTHRFSPLPTNASNKLKAATPEKLELRRLCSRHSRD